ncbi:hypothetical protein [Teichococcus aestuarii]|uniref:hypothetical protein n=1 Tax=Teichococcus aestuarii TaxID=568898 RepID=UPI003617D07F
MMTLDAAERALAALESAEDRDLPPEGADDATLRLLLWRLHGYWPSRAAVEALRIATVQERGRRRERRGAAMRRERRAQAAEAERRLLPARREETGTLLGELLASPEWGRAVAVAWETAWLLARCAVQQARWTEGAARALALPGLPRDTRGRREAAELLADYCRSKRVPAPPWAGRCWTSRGGSCPRRRWPGSMPRIPGRSPPWPRTWYACAGSGAPCTSGWPPSWPTALCAKPSGRSSRGLRPGRRVGCCPCLRPTSARNLRRGRRRARRLPRGGAGDAPA